ncbi:MAG: type II secretion system protein GspH [Robiginitomaculum sp.]|nr:MAG: type II secretion system protein GspH [Robiginitomaculum sp.]
MAKTPTFHQPTSRPRHAGRSSGYTLAELLVVLMILGLVTAIAAPRITMRSDPALMRTQSAQLVNLLRFAKITARRTGQSTRVMIAPLEKQIWIEGEDKSLNLSPKLSLSATGADAESTDKTIGIRFFADGMSTGGEIELGVGTMVRKIEVIWANGEVRLAQS